MFCITLWFLITVKVNTLNLLKRVLFNGIPMKVWTLNNAPSSKAKLMAKWIYIYTDKLHKYFYWYKQFYSSTLLASIEKPQMAHSVFLTWTLLHVALYTFSVYITALIAYWDINLMTHVQHGGGTKGFTLGKKNNTCVLTKCSTE